MGRELSASPYFSGSCTRGPKVAAGNEDGYAIPQGTVCNLSSAEIQLRTSMCPQEAYEELV